MEKPSSLMWQITLENRLGNNDASVLLQSPTWNGAAAAAATAAAASVIASADHCLALQNNTHQQKFAFWKLKFGC